LARTTYDNMPEVAAAREAASELGRRRQAAAAAEALVEDLLAQRDAAGVGEADASDGFVQAQLDGHHEEQMALRAIDERLRTQLAEITGREQQLHRDEQRVLAEALLAVQQVVLRKELEVVRLARAGLPGVDEKVIYSLALDDVRTAGDFVDVRIDSGRSKSDPATVVLVHAEGHDVRVSRLNPQQGQALLAWRRLQTDKHRHLLPAALEPAQAEELRAPFESERAALRARQTAVREAARRDGEAIRERTLAATPERALALQDVQRAAADQRLELDTALNRARKDAAEAQWRVTAAERAADAHGNLSFTAFLQALSGR
jgi:hypothetical protein